MKKLKLIFKALSIIMLLALTVSNNARGQSSCSSATLITTNNPNTCYMTGLEYWVKFVADSPSYKIKISKSGDLTPIADIKKYEFYSGTCSNLTLLSSKDTTIIIDTIVIWAKNLQQGNTYYIKFSQNSATPGYFSASLSPDPHPPMQCPTVCGTFVPNFNFETLGSCTLPAPTCCSASGSPFVDGIVCGWQDGWGSPQIIQDGNAQNPTHFAHMWHRYNDNRGEGIYAMFANAGYPNGLPTGSYTIRFSYRIHSTGVANSNDFYIGFLPDATGLSGALCGIGGSPIPAVVSGASPVYQYSINSGNGTNDQANWTQATWSFNVTGSPRIMVVYPKATASGALTHFDIDFSNFTVTVNPVTICAGCPLGNATLIANGFGGIPPYTYIWSNGLGSGAEKTVCPSVTTTYYVTGTDAGSCQATASAVVTVCSSSPITVNNETICRGLCATLIASGCGSDAYTWSNGQQGSSITVCPVQTITYYITAVCGNTASAVVTVNPTITASANQEICKGSCATITAYGGSTYTWSYGLGTGNTRNVCPVVTTTYYVTGTDASGCSGTASTVVSMNSLQKPLISGYNNICSGNAVAYSVQSQPNTNYTWNVTGWTQGGTPVSDIYTTSTTCSGTCTTTTITWNPAIDKLYGCNYARIIVTANNGVCTDKDTLYVFPCCEAQCDLILNNTIISAPITYTGRTIRLNGELVINANTTFNTCMFYLGPNAKITIRQNRTLNLNTCNLLATPCCYMWDGIYLSDNTATLNASGCNIEDAKNAVVSNNGGLYTIANTTFNKNYKGIVVNPYNTALHLGSVRASTFRCSTTLLPMLPPISGVTHSRSGMEVYNVQSLQIGNTTSAGNLNTFNGGGSGIDVGIFIKSSAVNIFNNTFTGFTATLPTSNDRGVAIYSRNDNQVNFTPGLRVGAKSQTGGIWKNTFTNCLRGMFSLDNTSFIIDDNTLIFNGTNTTWGINVQLTTAAPPPPSFFRIIANNEIYYYGNDIFAQNVTELLIDSNTIRIPAGNKACVNASACTNSRISCNKVFGTNTTNGFGVMVGQLYNSLIVGNLITTLYEGVYYFGVGAPSHLEVNTIQNNRYGFYLNNGLIGTQGAQNAPSDNVWGGNIINDLFSNNSNGSNSPFWCNPIGAPNSGGLSWMPVWTNGVTGNSVWAGICNGGQGQGMAAKSPTSDNVTLLNSIAENKIDFENYDTESKWLAKEGAYKYLLFNKDSLKDESMKKLKEKWDNENFGILQQVENSIANNNLEAAQNINISLRASVKPEKALQDYFTILISCRLNNWTLSKQELNDLTILAKQCPLEYGTAVYKARVLLRTFDNNEYTNKCEAIPGMSKDRGGDDNDNDNNTKKTDEQINDLVKSIKVYPNPANSELFVEYSLEKEQTGLFEMYDLLGNRIVHENLSNNSNLIKISLNDLNSGLYTYKIIIDGNEIRKDKLSIIK